MEILTLWFYRELNHFVEFFDGEADSGDDLAKGAARDISRMERNRSHSAIWMAIDPMRSFTFTDEREADALNHGLYFFGP